LTSKIFGKTKKKGGKVFNFITQCKTEQLRIENTTVTKAPPPIVVNNAPTVLGNVPALVYKLHELQEN
jgi:hypothetical protein